MAEIAQSPEAVALELLKLCAKADKKTNAQHEITADQGYIIDTYAECLRAAFGQRKGHEFERPGS